MRAFLSFRKKKSFPPDPLLCGTNMKRFYTLLFLLLIVATCPAQKINGHWYGSGKIEAGTSHNNYLTELVLQQQGKTITGTLNYYFRDTLFTQKVTGSFDANRRSLSLQPIPIIYHGSASVEMGVDCPMTGRFTLIASKTASNLKGNFIATEDYKYTCPSIKLTLTHSLDTNNLVLLKEKDEEEITNSDSMSTLPNSVKQLQFAAREKSVMQTIEVNNPTVQVQLYDNGIIDNDSVSVFVNDHLVQDKTMLSYSALSLQIQVDSTKEFTDISMFADNVGTMPPNTAVMILYDGNKRYEIQLSSDLQRTATVRLIRKFADHK